MNFFQAYGQSTGPATADSVVRNMVGVAKAGYEVEQGRQAQGMKERTLGLQEAYYNIAKVEEGRKAEEFARVNADRKKFIPASMFGIDQNNPTPQQKELMDTLLSAKLVENRGGIIGVTKENMPIAREFLSTRYDLQTKWAEMNMADMDKRILSNTSKLVGMAPDDPKRAELMAETEKIRGQLEVQSKAHEIAVKRSKEYIEKAGLENIKAEGRLEAVTEAAKIRADAAETVAGIRAEQSKDREERAKEGKELQKRNATHKEVEKIFGISEFLESAKDPELRRNYGEVAAFSDEVARNPKGYGLNASAGEAEIAKKAYDIWAMMNGRKQAPKSVPAGKPPLSAFGGKK